MQRENGEIVAVTRGQATNHKHLDPMLRQPSHVASQQRMSLKARSSLPYLFVRSQRGLTDHWEMHSNS